MLAQQRERFQREMMDRAWLFHCFAVFAAELQRKRGRNFIIHQVPYCTRALGREMLKKCDVKIAHTHKAKERFYFSLAAGNSDFCDGLAVVWVV